MKTSIYDIAKAAGVSSATVSRVLNNKESVSPHTRRKVKEVIERLDYRPNVFARGLVSSRSPTVGILTIDIRVPHYASTAFAMEHELFMLGYSTILCNTGGGLENSVEYLRMLVEKGVSGIMCIGSVFRDTFHHTSVLSEFPDLPFIFSNCVLTAENAYSVIIDENRALSTCVEHLVSKGHSDILYVKDTDSYSGKRKADSFRGAMMAAGCNLHEKSVFSVQRGLLGGVEAICQIIDSKAKFTAIIFGDDFTAVGGLNELRRRGYSVPGDVAIIGFNNSVASRCCTPAMTTVDNKTDMMGRFTVRLFQTVIEGRPSTKLLTVTPELIERETT